MESFIFYTLKSSLCLSAGFLIYYLLIRRESFHRLKRFILLGIIFCALLVPLVKIKVEPARLNFTPQTPKSDISRTIPAVFPVQEPMERLVNRKESNTTDFLTLFYLVGASIQVILIFYSLARILILVRKSRKINFEGLRLALVPSVVVPFCFGRRIVISEKDFSEHGREILLHEQTHLAKFHGLDLIFSEFYLVMTWYNPFSWFIRHELKQNHEFEADSHVILEGTDATEYQLLLVRKAAGEVRYNLANQFNQSNIKNRIAMMNKRKSNPGAILKVLFFIPFIVLMVQIFAQKEIKQPGTSANKPLHGKYLQLAPEQLKLLGFEIQPSGLFYKNTRFGRPDKGILCLCFTEEINNTSIILKPGEKFTGNSGPEKILKKQVLTNHDFYPVVVAHFNGFRNQDMSAAESNPEEELLPVQINMADLKLGKRADTLVFWFKPTQSLKDLLSANASVDEYLQRCPESPMKPGENAKRH